MFRRAERTHPCLYRPGRAPTRRGKDRVSSRTGLFQLDLYQIDEVVPAQADLLTDPLGQVVAVIAAYLPEGFGSDLYAWQETAYLRAGFAREKVELIRAIEGEFSVEGEWDI